MFRCSGGGCGDGDVGEEERGRIPSWGGVGTQILLEGSSYSTVISDVQVNVNLVYVQKFEISFRWYTQINQG